MNDTDRDMRMALALLPLVLVFLALAAAENAVIWAIRSSRRTRRTPGYHQPS